MTQDTPDNKQHTAVMSANTETVSRYGAANAEFLKGLRGIDHETGQVLDRSLRDVARYRIDPSNPENSISQQAGFSAEIAKTSRDNARHIIEGNDIRVARTEDVAGFGKNHPVADHVELNGGVADPSSISQMKFLNDPESFLSKVARGDGGGKNDLSRYLDNQAIDLPTEQVESARAYCREQAHALREQAQAVDALGSKPEVAEKLRQDADNFERLEGKIRDGGLTREEARDYRLNPELETARDLVRTSHDAALEGAKICAVICGTISLVMNGVAVLSGDKDLEDAAQDFLAETGTAAGVGYAGTFAGAALKGLMQQSESGVTRALSRTALPALAVTTCLAFGKSITAYANGELTETALMEQISSTVSGTLASSMCTSVGQIVIPIPILGALIGGMVGSTIATMFHQAFVEAGRNAELARDRYIAIQAHCVVAREQAWRYRQHIDFVFETKLSRLHDGREKLVLVLAELDVAGDSDAFCTGINRFATLLGKQLAFDNREEFDAFMQDENKTLKL